jgi:hypothetical protein
MWDWVTGVASTAWNWATENTSTIGETVGGYITSRNISTDEGRALQEGTGSMKNISNPSLSQYRTSVSRSNAGVSSYADIKEASGTKYAQFLYYTRSYLQTKAKYEGSVPRVSYKKSGLGSKS